MFLTPSNCEADRRDAQPLASNRGAVQTVISAQGSPSQVVEPNKGHKGTIAAPPKILRSKLNKERKRKRASQELSSSRAVDDEYVYRAPVRLHDMTATVRLLTSIIRNEYGKEMFRTRRLPSETA